MRGLTAIELAADPQYVRALLTSDGRGRREKAAILRQILVILATDPPMLSTLLAQVEEAIQ